MRWTPWNVNTWDVADDISQLPQTPQKTSNQWKFKQFWKQTNRHIWWIGCHGMYGYIFILQMRAKTYETANAPLAKFARPIGTMYLIFYPHFRRKYSWSLCFSACLLMLMISNKAILTLNATSMDLIPVYIFCRFNKISKFWYFDICIMQKHY